MSIELADVNDSLGQAATNTGFDDAARAVERLSGLDNLKDLFENGETDQPLLASNEALLAAHKVKDTQISSTLVNMSKLLKKAKDKAMVVTG